MPDITGLTLAEADRRLRHAHLTIAWQSNAEAFPTAISRMKRQIPEARQTVPTGTAVSILRDRRTKTASLPSTRRAGASPTCRRSRRPLKHPWREKLAQAGLIPVVKRIYSGEKTGTVLRRTAPRAGSKLKPGPEVSVLVSAGFPGIAFDDDRDILLRDGFHATPLDPIAHSTTHTEKDPTFSADGTRVGVESDGRVSPIADRGAPRQRHGRADPRRRDLQRPCLRPHVES